MKPTFLHTDPTALAVVEKACTLARLGGARRCDAAALGAFLEDRLEWEDEAGGGEGSAEDRAATVVVSLAQDASDECLEAHLHRDAFRAMMRHTGVVEAYTPEEWKQRKEGHPTIGGPIRPDHRRGGYVWAFVAWEPLFAAMRI